MTRLHAAEDYHKRDVKFECGFPLSTDDVVAAVVNANTQLGLLPATLWRSIDLKVTGSIVGAFLADAIAVRTGSIINPIEKGHPDVLPKSARDASEAQLRNYPVGLEIKGTCGGIPKGVVRRAGESRCDVLVGVTWQAHHREVRKLLGLIWDFASVATSHSAPTITAVLYSRSLERDDWGQISGTSGRNTKVTGLRASGRQKMAAGLVCILRDPRYIERYSRILSEMPDPTSATGR